MHYISVTMQHLTQSKTGLRACNTLPGAACSPAASPPLQYYCTYFLSSILNLARATAVYIYIVLNCRDTSCCLAVRTSYLCITPYSCTNLVHLYSRAPISCTSTLVHQSRAPLLLCTNLVHHQSRAPLELVHTQEGILMIAVEMLPSAHVH